MRLRLSLVPTIAAAALALGMAVPAIAQDDEADEPTVTGASQVTGNPDPARAHSSPQLAVNPTNGELALVETEVRSDLSCVVSLSTDGGRSWRPGGALHEEPYTECSRSPINGPYASLAFSSDGDLYVAYMASDPKEAGAETLPVGIFLARSEDGGRNFESFQVSEPTEDARKARAMLAVDPNDADTVHVSWMQRPEEGKSLAQVATTTDGGETFSEPTDLSLEQGGYQPRLAVGPDSTVHAVFPGSTFHEETPFDEVVRPLMYARSTDGGDSWSEAEEIDPGNTNFYAMRKAVIAVDQNDGTVYTAWYGNEKTTIDPQVDDVDIFLRRSTDGGDTWSERVTINDDADEDRHINHYNPGISIAPNGRVDVAWYDFRNSPYPERFPDGFTPPFNHDGFQDVYYSYSTDGGETWAPNIRVTDRIINREIGVWSNNIHSHMSVGVASTDLGASFAWQDTRNGNYRNEAEDVYAASVLHGPGLAGGPGAAGAAGAPSPDNSVLWAFMGGAVALALGGSALLVGTRVARRVPPAEGKEPVPVRGGSE